MYRQGLGDCFLITLPRTTGSPYYIMIDCGVILGTHDAAVKMNDVIADIVATTGGQVDLLAVTHEHWDHVSGFVQAKEAFSKLKIKHVWVAWTENPDDAIANQLRGEHQALRLALTSAYARMGLGSTGDSTACTLLEFFGAAGQNSTRHALDFAKGLGTTPPRFCLPSDAPVELEGTDARIYILGPPHDVRQIKRSNPSQAHPETYGIDSMPTVMPVVGEVDPNAPFDPIVQIPLEAARQMPHFQTRYWGEDADSPEKDQFWRRIDDDWLAVSYGLALQLDNATNNTSLVLAIQLKNGNVLLFAADAQVGNWLSWQDLKWTVDGATITGPDLLARTILYKTGHHGSHNATLREKGLEQMKNLQIALIPVDQEMASKKGWDQMPFNKLQTRLNEITKNRVLRIDQEVPPALADRVVATDLYFEVTWDTL